MWMLELLSLDQLHMLSQRSLHQRRISSLRRPRYALIVIMYASDDYPRKHLIVGVHMESTLIQLGETKTASKVLLYMLSKKAG